MAIVHIATKAISRKAGQSAVASAAYRAGVILNDEKYNKSHDYSRKSGVMSADIILPSRLQAEGMLVSREEIWNKAEHVEIRKDSRVAREWLVNLPHELDEDKRKRLAHDFAQVLADKYNVIADVCIHKPVMKAPYDPGKKPSSKRLRQGEENPDPRNYHAHILVTTREAKLDADGSLIFDSKFKIPFEWSNKKRAEHNLQSSIQEIKDIRQLWVDMANKALAEHDITPLDARSFKDQGLDRLPTIKMGVDATNMERKGINTDKGNENRAIRVINQRKEFIEQNKQRVAADEQHIVEYTEWAADRVEWVNNRHQQIIKCIDNNQQRIERRKRDTEWTVREDQTIRTVIEGNSKRAEWNANIASRNSRNAEWAIKQGERIVRIAGAREPDDKTREQRTEDYQRQASNVNRIIAKRARRSAAPSPFDDNARRARAASRKQRLAELDEQSERFHYTAERADRDITDHHYHDESANKAVRSIKIKLAMALLNRHHPNSSLQPKSETVDEYPDKFDERQIKSLDEFAAAIGAIRKTRDFKQDCWDSASLFTADMVEQHANIIQMLRNPAKEREQYNNSIPETALSSPQSDLNSLTRDSTRSIPQTSNTASESISISSRRYRP